MTVINKVIHRFVRDRAEYEENGALFNQIIPYNVQAYSYELKNDGDPSNPEDYIIRYVLGTGKSTYIEIANGQGIDEDGNPVPELSKEFTITSYHQLKEIIGELGGNYIEHLDILDDITVKDHYGEIVQYDGETTTDYTKGYFYLGNEGYSDYRLSGDSVLDGITGVYIDQDMFKAKITELKHPIPVIFEYQNGVWSVRFADGFISGISSEGLNNLFGITWTGTPVEDVTTLNVYKYKEPDTWINVDTSDLSTIRQAIDTEIANRIAAVNAEKERAQQAESALSGDISIVDGRVTQEISDRQAADSNLHNEVVAEENRAVNVESGLAQDISTETTNRQSQDVILDNSITAEKTRAQAAELALSGDISAEATARSSADTALGTRIDDEASARSSADISLSGRIDTVVSNLSDEASTRASVDLSLGDRITGETNARVAADNDLQGQIDSIVASSDVKDIVGTHADLENYDTSTLGDRDIIKVLQDETENNATTYYRWIENDEDFELIGEEGPFYTKSETNDLLAGKVSKTGDTISGDLKIKGTTGTSLGFIKNTNETDYVRLYPTADANGGGLQVYTTNSGGSLSGYYILGKNSFHSDSTQTIGDSTHTWSKVFTEKLNNGADLTVPSSGGTIARLEDLPSAEQGTVDQVYTKTQDGAEWADPTIITFRRWGANN